MHVLYTHTATKQASCNAPGVKWCLITEHINILAGARRFIPIEFAKLECWDYYFGWGLRFWARDEFRRQIVMNYISGSFENDRLQ